MSARVCAVVVDWNGAAWTRDCLRALERTRFDGTLDAVVVDNCSDDPAALADVASPPRVRVVRLPRNVGFGAGSNAGIRIGLEEGADWIWLLNNDAAPEPGALHAMLVAGESDPAIGAVGGTLDETAPGGPRTIVHGGGAVSFASGLARHHEHAVPIERVDYLCAASMLVRRAALERAGMFDERFFLYWEDVDLSFRLRAAGFRLAVADDAVVKHRAHASQALASEGWDRHFTRSSALFFRKHAAAGRPAALPIAVGSLGRLVKRLAAGRIGNARAVWDGLRLGCAG